jgi:hypothetical protein
MTRTPCYDVIPMVRNCLTCGRDHTADDWRALDWIETQDLPGDEGETPMRLEWRRCTCGNALSVDLADPRWESFAGQRGPVDAALAAADAERRAAEHLAVEMSSLLRLRDDGRAMLRAMSDYGACVRASRAAARALKGVCHG